jgi:hypothetical protein
LPSAGLSELWIEWIKGVLLILVPKILEDRTLKFMVAVFGDVLFRMTRVQAKKDNPGCVRVPDKRLGQ